MKNRIRALRMEKNITQVRLSIELGVAQETISAYIAKSDLKKSGKAFIPFPDFFIFTELISGNLWKNPVFP